MSSFNVQRLREIKTFPSLVKYLRDELDWPIESDNFDDLTFDYEPDELGIDAKTAIRIKEIKQLRPLSSKQPWGIFFINFEPKQLPIVVLRRILGSLVIKKRASASKSQQAAWQLHDLLFISSYGESEHRDITFAHFSEPTDRLFGDLPTLRVLGWDDDDTKLKIDHVVHVLSEKLRWPQDETDTESWRTKWSDAFELRPREVITTSKELAIRLAELAKSIRQRANLILGIESEKGSLRKLHKAFQTALIHDLNEDDFADMYAQTIAYGLLAARVSRPAGIIADNLADMIPTNPFLKDMLGTFLTVGGRKNKIDFDELGIQEVVDVLNRPDTHIEAVMRDFGKKTMQEDPVVHFYELFLKEYDKKKKVERGVFYTPQPVVSYIVRSVHELLKTEFGLEDGLASIVTWGEMVKRNSEIKIPEGVSPDEPFVLILDIATGTATFLVEVIEVIYQTMISKWRKEKYTEFELGGLWNEYVPKHLLPRLYGYELMMAPYAIAHMKIGLKLAETGYRFGSNERAHIYLTNSLEPPTDLAEQPQFEEMAPALAHEARAVNAVKRNKRFTVVVGNPPYSNFGRLNKIPFIIDLLEDYKRDLGEKKINLDDDFIKFVRFSQYILNRSGIGLHGMITNNVYIDGLTHRIMRNSLVETFQKIRIVDLHGNVSAKEKAPDGSEDKNVFDIKQGVAISLMVRSVNPDTNSRVSVIDLYGPRDKKYQQLLQRPGFNMPDIEEFHPHPPNYFFCRRKDASIEKEYESFIAASDIFNVFAYGIQTKQDSLFVDIDKVALEARIREVLYDVEKLGTKKASSKHGLGASSGWSAQRLQGLKYDQRYIRQILYRPFDLRYIYYDPKALGRARWDTMRHFAQPNIGFINMRQVFQEMESYSHIGITNCLIDERTFYSNRGGTYLIPLYLFDNCNLFQASNNDSGHKHFNISSGFVERLKTYGQAALKDEAGVEAIFAYITATQHSAIYRRRYLNQLRIDFPRLPFTDNLELFKELVKYGRDLIALHLLESPKLDKHITHFMGNATPEVEKASYSDNTVWIDKAKSQGFTGVLENVWSFQIGGYQVCEKWLKDRGPKSGNPGRTLSTDDINHYHRIVVALSETIRIMAEIDKVIEAHGGWPGAFQEIKAANVKYAFQPEPLLKAAEETAAYSPQGKVEVYSKSIPSLKGDWQTWLALSQWTKEKGQINTFWSDFALEISNSLKVGKKLTDKQKEEMKKCWKQAVKKGFRP